MEDAQIIALYWSRDGEAIRQTDEKYGAYCFTIAQRIVQSHEDSEECVNDTWLRAWNAMPPERPDYLKLFLAAITRNLSLDRLKERKTGQARRRCGSTGAGRAERMRFRLAGGRGRGHCEGAFRERRKVPRHAAAGNEKAVSAQVFLSGIRRGDRSNVRDASRNGDGRAPSDEKKAAGASEKGGILR